MNNIENSQSSKTIQFYPKSIMHIKYFLLQTKNSQKQNYTLCYVESFKYLVPNSVIHGIALKKYYLHLEETNASHWFVKNKTRKIHQRSRKLYKKVSQNIETCFYCGHKLSKENKTLLSKTIDHFVPLSKGGSGKKDNLRVCCGQCNVTKGNIHPYLEPEKYQEFLQIVQKKLEQIPKELAETTL